MLSAFQEEMTDKQKSIEAMRARVQTKHFKQDTDNAVSQNAVVVRESDVLPWYRNIRVPFFKRKSQEEKSFLESMRFWSPVFESIEKTTGSRIDLSFFKSYRVRNNKLDFEHWASFTVIPFLNADGAREFYFFADEAPSKRGLENPDLIKEVSHRDGGIVFQHNGRSYGRLEDLDVFKLSTGYMEQLSYETLSNHPDVKSIDISLYKHYMGANGPRAIVLPISKTESLKIVDAGKSNEVSVVERDNTRWFFEERDDAQILGLYRDWNNARAEGIEGQTLELFYDKHRREIDELIEGLNESSLTTLEVETVIIKLQLKIREISRLQSLTMSDWFSEPARSLFRRNQHLAPSSVGINRALDEVTSLLMFKTTYLYKLNELFLYFDHSVESLKGILEGVSDGTHQRVLSEGLKEDLNSEVRESVRLTVEGAYLLEKNRLESLQSLVQRLALTSSTLRESELLEISKSLEKLLLGEEGVDKGIPMNLNLDTPVLEFDFLMELHKGRIPMGRMPIII